MTSWALPVDMLELAEAGEGEAIRGILEMFLDETRSHIQEIGSAIESGNGIRVEYLGHALKGGCAQVGAFRLSKIAAEWERGGANPESWRDLRTAFEAEFERVQSTILAHPILTGQ